MRTPADGRSCGRGHQPRIAAGRAEMKSIAHGDGGKGVFARAFDRELYRLPRGELSERIAGIDHDCARLVAHHLAESAL